MNNQDEKKALEIALKEFPDKFEHETWGSPNIEVLKAQRACLEMAAWKEQQMVENAVEWFENNFIDNAFRSNDLKKAMDK